VSVPPLTLALNICVPSRSSPLCVIASQHATVLRATFPWNAYGASSGERRLVSYRFGLSRPALGLSPPTAYILPALLCKSAGIACTLSQRETAAERWRCPRSSARASSTQHHALRRLATLLTSAPSIYHWCPPRAEQAPLAEHPHLRPPALALPRQCTLAWNQAAARGAGSIGHAPTRRVAGKWSSPYSRVLVILARRPVTEGVGRS